MPKLIDKTGKRFGRLVVLERGPDHEWPNSRPTPQWRCVCECGKEALVLSSNLGSGKTLSCGCLLVERRGASQRTHGMTRSTEHVIWSGMMARCYRPNLKAYPLYGGRGIVVCDRWHDFANFYADMGPRPVGKTLDRMNNDGPYSPDNCRWASRLEQNRNKRSNVLVPYDGRLVSLSELADLTGLPYGTIQTRNITGWAKEDLVLPKRKNQWG